MSASISIASTLEERCVPPKRCRTAYNIFYQAERNRIVAAIPDQPKSSSPKGSKGRPAPHGKIGFQDLARKISAAWKGLTDDERSEYITIARADKERYLQEKEAWQDSVAELERIHSSWSLENISWGQSRSKKSNKISKTNQCSSRTPSAICPPHLISPSRTPSPILASDNIFEPTPISHMESIDPYAPMSYGCMGFIDYSFSQVEVQSLERVSRELDTASLKFIIARFS